MKVNEELKKILSDRFEAWELAEFLQVSCNDFIDAFEDDILDNWDDVEEFAGLRKPLDEDDDDEV